MSQKICSKCIAINDGLRWHYDQEQHGKLKRQGAEVTICPGCERLDKRRVDGVVSLKGGFLKDHRIEAVNLINNISDRQKTRSVVARIYNLCEDGEGITVKTTDQALAERIGKEFEKAFSGDLSIQWLDGAEFVRVDWHRD